MTLIDQQKIQIIHHYLEIVDKSNQISLQHRMCIFLFRCDDDVEITSRNESNRNRLKRFDFYFRIEIDSNRKSRTRIIQFRFESITIRNELSRNQCFSKKKNSSLVLIMIIYNSRFTNYSVVLLSSSSHHVINHIFNIFILN